MSEDIQTELNKVRNELDTLRKDFTEYAYIVSHDLAAPFRQIEGFADIILSNNGDNFDEKTRRHFDIIAKGSKRGSQIVQALQTYSRLCSQIPDMKEVDCNEVLDDVLMQLAPMIKDTKAQINCTNLPVAKADGRQLERHFSNLIHNALLYSKADSNPKIDIDCSESESCWEFCISDNGIGIPDKQQDKIFEVLRRAVLDKQYEGVGMGLAISRRIVQNHSGKIWVTDRPEKGSTFHFTIAKEL